MSSTIELAEKYFELSNSHDFEAIAKLFTEDTVYISANTGTYGGRDAIMKMMIPFHESFRELRWNINKVNELSDNTVEIDFTMSGTKKTGETVEVSGAESIKVAGERISRIEIKNS